MGCGELELSGINMETDEINRKRRIEIIIIMFNRMQHPAKIIRKSWKQKEKDNRLTQPQNIILLSRGILMHGIN